MRDYQDDALKIAYYKQEIIKEMSRLGMAPNQLGIKQRLEEIDEKVAIFRYASNDKGEKIDVAALKTAFTAIAMDLSILYKAIVTYRRNELLQLSEYVDTRLSALEQTATQYETALSNDLACTSLGKAIYVQTSNYQWTYNNGIFKLPMPDIATLENKKLCFLLGATDNVKGNTLLKFTMKDIKYVCSPFDISTKTIATPTADNLTEYTFTRNNDLTAGSLLLLNCDKLTVLPEKKYTILAGKGKLLQTTATTKNIASCNMHETIASDNVSTFTFTVYKGTFLRIDTTAEPDWSNINVNAEVKSNTIQQVKLKMPKGSAWKVTTDGTVYAYCEDGVVTNKKLYYPGNEAGSITDFLVLEKETDKKITISNVSVEITADTAVFPSISYIAIKEASV